MSTLTRLQPLLSKRVVFTSPSLSQSTATPASPSHHSSNLIPRHLHPSQKISLTSTAHSFSHSQRLYSTTSPAPKPEGNSGDKVKTKPTSPKQENPSFGPAVSFRDLGATRTVKIVLVIALSIMATAETVTYGIWGWKKWVDWREGQVGGDGDGSSEGSGSGS